MIEQSLTLITVATSALAVVFVAMVASSAVTKFMEGLTK